MSAQLTPRQRALQLAVRSGMDGMTAVTHADQLETLCDLVRADQPDESQRLRDACWRLEWCVGAVFIIGVANLGLSAAQVMA